jgi:hypothetical protein
MQTGLVFIGHIETPLSAPMPICALQWLPIRDGLPVRECMDAEKVANVSARSGVY